MVQNDDSSSSQHSLRAYPCYEALVCDGLQHLLHDLVAWGAMEAIGVYAGMTSVRHDHRGRAPAAVENWRSAIGVYA